MRRHVPGLVLASLLAGCGHGPFVAAPTLPGTTMQASSLHEILVKPRAGMADRVAASGWQVVRQVEPLGWQVVRVSGDATIALQHLRRQPWVAASELQHVVHTPKGVPHQPARQGLMPAPMVTGFNDPDLAKCAEYQSRVLIQQAWQITTGQPDVVVAVLDTGADFGHPDLKNRLVPGYDFVHDRPDATDDNSHGTACSGMIAAEANNGIGVAGLAPDVRVMPVKVLDQLGNGPLETAAKGLVWAADHGAKVVSMSFGEDAPSQVLEDAIAYARAKDVVLVASMGNDGQEVVKHWPAASNGVLAVGATYAEDDTPAMFSTAGDWIGISAPGDRVWTTMPTYPTPNPISDPDRNYYWFEGTSASGPVVAAVAALVRTRFPQLNEAQVRARLRATADDVGAKGWDNLTGDGRVNALRALTAPL